MNPFLCIVDLSGLPLGQDVVAAALPGLCRGEGQVGAVLHECWGAGWVTSRGQDGAARPVVAHRSGIVVVGTARLSNRAELLRQSAWAGALPEGITDLDLVIDQYLQWGSGAARRLVGDFAFVVWDTQRRTVFAARDAIGVKSLFYQQRGTRLLVASHVGCLQQGEYDREFLGHFLIGQPTASTRTAWSDITRLAAGTSLLVEDGRLSTRQYWEPAEFVARNTPLDETEAATEFRRLFGEAVLAQIDDPATTWAQLSGGLDSSSIVGMASTRSGLAGTVTVVDSLGNCDETRYSNAVVGKYGVRNEQLVDFWGWQQDALGPAGNGEPYLVLPFFARDREMVRVVRDAGATVLLNGMGADHYLTGTSDLVSDLLAAGEYRAAGRHVVDLAIATRQSVWKLGFRHGIYPRAPRWLKRRWVADYQRVPAWVSPGLVREFDLADRMAWLDQPASGHGVYADHVATEVGRLDWTTESEIFQDGLEVRYPFYHRPLVEFGLGLPASLRTRPNQPKWILRQALRDLLPEAVRNRTDKGGIDGRISWSFNRERRVLSQLVANSHLGDLGCIDGQALKTAFRAACDGTLLSVGSLFTTLSLETWLAARSGWWTLRAGSSTNIHWTPVPVGIRSRKEHSDVEAAIY